jgi:hypothetical protein
MSLTLCLLLCAGVADVYTDKAKIEGLGEIALPPGKWELEIAQLPTKPGERALFVFKKQGDRLERLSFQCVPPEIAAPLGNYFDSIGDSYSNGIPLRGKEKREHDTTYIIEPLRVFRSTEGKDTGMTSSYIYTDEKGNVPWMSHACVTKEGEAVLISVHSSPFVLAPDTIQDVISDSKFEKPPKNAK